MVVLELMKSRQSHNLQWVIEEATKLGCVKNLEEAMKDGNNVVLVAKVRSLEPVNKLNSVRRLLLKEVNKNGSYGKKFHAFLFGNVANDTKSANLCIGDRLIFIQPYIVLNPQFDKPTDIHRLQVECGVKDFKNQRHIKNQKLSENQRIILLKKKIENDRSDVDNTTTTTVETNTKKTIPTKLSENTKNVETAKESSAETRLDKPASSNPFTSHFSEVTIDGAHFRKSNNGVNCILINNNVQKISTKTNYVYKKIADIKEPEFKVNVYVIVCEVLKVQSVIASQRKIVILKGIDETCTDKQRFIIRIMFDETDEFYKTIKPNIILRMHRMKVDYNEGVLGGTVFKGSDVLVFKSNNKTVSSFLTSAKTFTFTDHDKERVNDLCQWLHQVYLPIHVGRDLGWQSLNSIRPDELFQMHCLVNDITIHPVTNTLVLHVCDGLSCPHRVYQVPVKEEYWTEKSEYFVQNLSTVDVLVESPSDKIQGVKKGSYIVLGPVKLRQCEVDPKDPKYYKMELLENENSVKVLDKLDPAVKRINRRLEEKSQQENKSSNVESMVDKNNQKETVYKEKRKLFNVTDNMDHSGPKRKKNETEITKSVEENNTSKEERIKSPFEEEELFNFASTIPSTAYTDQNDNKTNSGTTSSKLTLKRKLSASKLNNVPEICQVPITQLPTKENEERQKTDKSKLLNELKTKRIDTMSQESVDKCFEELGSMLTKYAKSKSSPKESPNNVQTKVEVHHVLSSSSSSSVVLMESVNQPSDVTKCPPASVSSNENNIEVTEEKTLVVKLVQLPPGKKSRVVVKDNVVLVEMDDKGVVDDAKQISLLSLLEEQLGKKLTTTKTDNSTVSKYLENLTDKEDKPVSEENGTIKNSILGKGNRKIQKCRTKQQTVDTSLADRFKLNELILEKLPSEKNSNATKTTFKRNITYVNGHSKPNLLNKNSRKSNYLKSSNDNIDLCDANTIINEKVNKDSCSVVSIASSEATTIRNPDNCKQQEEDDEVFLNNDVTDSSHISSVKDWLNKMDYSPTRDEDAALCKYKRIDSSAIYINPMLLSEASTEDKHVFDNKIIRTMVYLLEVEPAFYKEEPMDLTSGFCFTGCHELFLCSTLLLIETEAVCPKCYASGEIRVVQMMFALRMKVMDPAGKLLTVLLFRQYAEKFFGCSVTSYIHNLEKRKRVINLLSGLKFDSKKTFLCPINMCIGSVDSQNIVTDTRIYYKT